MCHTRLRAPTYLLDCTYWIILTGSYLLDRTYGILLTGSYLQVFNSGVEPYLLDPTYSYTNRCAKDEGTCGADPNVLTYSYETCGMVDR